MYQQYVFLQQVSAARMAHTINLRRHWLPGPAALRLLTAANTIGPLGQPGHRLLYYVQYALVTDDRTSDRTDNGTSASPHFCGGTSQVFAGAVAIRYDTECTSYAQS